MDEMFSVARACSILNISEEIYCRIVSKAIDQTQKDLNELSIACQCDDIKKIEAISHRLKGDYANLRIDHLSEIAGRLNKISKVGYDRVNAESMVDELRDAFERLTVLFQEKN